MFGLSAFFRLGDISRPFSFQPAQTTPPDPGDPPIVVSSFHGGNHLHVGLARVRSIRGLKGGNAFTRTSPGEAEWFEFDFVDLLSPGEIIVTPTWDIEVDHGVDDDPESRLIGLPVIQGSKIRQMLADMVEDVTYDLECVAITDSGQRLELEGTVRCKAGSVGSFSPPITENEIEWVGFDYTDLIPPGEILINGLFDVSVKKSLTLDTTLDEMKVLDVVLRGNEVWQLINAQKGQPGNAYTFLCYGITDAGQKLALRRSIKIKAE